MKRLLPLAFILLLPALSLSAQKGANDELGFHPEKLYDFQNVDSVSLFNGNLMLALPLTSHRVSSTLSYQLTLTYNSKVFDYETWDCVDPQTGLTMRCEHVLPNLRSSAGLGWRVSLGRLLPPTEPSMETSLARYGYVYEGPAGDEHKFGVINDEQAIVQLTNNAPALRLIKVTNTIREVEFPTGEVHRFVRENSVWRLKQIRGRFSDSVDIAYVYSDDGKREVQWIITDTAGRRHDVYFDNYETMADGWSRGQQVRSIAYRSFDGDVSFYTFEYTPALTAAPCAFNDSEVPLLTKLELSTFGQPDVSTYEFTYHSSAVLPCDWGPLKTIRFPTGGTVAYTYQQYHLAQDEVCANLPWGQYFVMPNSGIRTRTIADGSTTREWEYVQRRGPQIPIDYGTPDPCHTNSPPVGPFYWSRTSVLSPVDANNERTRTDSYFNLFDGTSPDPFWPGNGSMPYGYPLIAGMPPATRAKGPVDVVPEEDPTWPRDISASDGARYLATQIYSGCSSNGDCTNGTLLRSNYNLYEPTLFDWQLSSSRTVDHDDTGCGAACYTQVTSSDPDGAGNYRLSTGESNFPGSHTISSYTALPTWTGPDRTNSTYAWITNVFSEKSRTENGVTAREQFCFEEGTGFLLRHRVLAGATPASNDVLSVFERDGSGNVQYALSYGGDKQTLDSDPDLCTLPLPGAFWYKSEQHYTNGVLAWSRFYDRTTLQPFGFRHVDRTIDPTTGAVIEVRDSPGVATSYTYWPSPLRVKSMTNPGGVVTTYDYTSASGTPATGLSRAIVDTSTPSASGTLRSRFVFDGLGRVLRRSSLGPQNTWNATEIARDEMGRAAWTSQPESTGVNPPSGSLVAAHKTLYEYDALGRPVQVTLPDGTVTSMSYQGSRIATRISTIAAGAATETPVATREEYDSSGRLVAVTENVDLDPTGGAEGEMTTSYTYDVGGRLASVSMPGAAGTQTRTFTYDRRGFLTQDQHPEVGVNGNGMTNWSQYDARGHAGRKTISTTIDLRYEYDSAERLIRIKDAKVASRDLELFAWDCIRFDVAAPCVADTHPGRLAASARYNYDPELGTIAVTDANQYDATTGHLVRRDQTVGTGEIGGNTLFQGESFFFVETHNDLGLVDTLTYPCRSTPTGCPGADPGRVVPHGYANGVLTSLGTWASSVTYRPNGTVDTVTHGNGSGATREKWEADPNGMARPRRIYSTNASGSQELWSSGNYEYDGSGNVKKIGNTSYVYDAFGRLNGWTSTSPSGMSGGYSETSRSYDEFGNYVSTLESGCGPGPKPLCYSTTLLPREVRGTTNHYVDTSYDGAGNVVLDVDQRAYTWDPLGMMTGATVDGRTFRYLYDASNERIAAVEREPVAATLRNRTTFTLRGTGNQLLSTWTDDWTSGTRLFTRKEDMIWRGSQLLARADGASAMNYTVDHLGSPRFITNGSGSVIDQQNFDPFGAGGLYGSGALQFTGHERDQANLGSGSFNLPDYFHARFYDKAGRFLSVDPIDSADPRFPQSWNRYSYTRNNPLTRIDPDGRSDMYFDPDDSGGVIRLRINVWYDRASVDRELVRGSTVRVRTEKSISEARAIFATAGIRLDFVRQDVETSGQGLRVVTESGVTDFMKFASTTPGLDVLVTQDQGVTGLTAGTGGPTLIGNRVGNGTVTDELAHALGNTRSLLPLANLWTDLYTDFNERAAANGRPMNDFYIIMLRGAARELCQGDPLACN